MIQVSCFHIYIKHLFQGICIIFILFLDGKNKALIIEMSLEPSTYATMGLREILKNDTSAETQVALSASYDAENVQSSTSTVNVIV